MVADKQSRKKRKKPSKKPGVVGPSKKPIVLTPSQDKVSHILAKAEAPRTTAEIAKDSGLKQSQVYSICQSLKKKGIFEKGKKPREKPLYYAPIVNQTLHTGNYNLIIKLNKELKRIIDDYELKDPKMEAALKKFFRSILRQYPHYHNQIVSGMEKLFRVIKRARSKEEVLDLLGLRPSYPEVCVWEPGPGWPGPGN